MTEPSVPPDRLADFAAAGLAKARPWDLVGIAVAGLMIVWGLLGWFGSVGDSGAGIPGFYSGTGAAAIGLVLAAAGTTLAQVLAGRPHVAVAPPVSVFLAGAAVIVIVGGMVAKPASTTIGAGVVAGLLTALTQVVTLTIGWLQGSGKSVRAANLQAYEANQRAADEAARHQPPPGRYPPGGSYGPGGFPWGQPPPGQFGGQPGGQFGGQPGGQFGGQPGGQFGSQPGGPPVVRTRWGNPNNPGYPTNPGNPTDPGYPNNPGYPTDPGNTRPR
ncbi:MAG: hypothetical protein JWN95_1048 [Frankiales bacterium]|nr:hypothetical protein [Frankiales bacterium]